MILFDTSVLSRVFRRTAAGSEEKSLRLKVDAMLKEDVPLGIPVLVLQELLTGIRSEQQFAELQSTLLGSFEIIHPDTDNYVEAARLQNKCIAKGFNVSGPDCLIAAVTISEGHELFAIDTDFQTIARIAPLKLYLP